MTESPSESLGDLYNLLLQQATETEFPPGRRIQLSLASFAIVRDHHHAIAILLDLRLHASAFVLVRPLYEAAVKGMWLAHCATEAESERYVKGFELDQVGDLLDDLLKSRLPASLSEQLQRIKTLYWKPLSSFVHAGHAQVTRWLTSTGVGNEYTEVEIAEIANFTAFVAVLASLERARLGKDEVAMASIAKLLPAGMSHEP